MISIGGLRKASASVLVDVSPDRLESWLSRFWPKPDVLKKDALKFWHHVWGEPVFVGGFAQNGVLLERISTLFTIYVYV